MADVKLYGETEEERLIREKQQCRLIVKEILDFGVSERQKYQLLKLLAENLENFDHMKLVCDLVDKCTTVDVGDLLGKKNEAMAKLAEEQEQING